MPVKFVFRPFRQICLIAMFVAASDWARSADTETEPAALGLVAVSKRPIPKRDPADQPFRRAPMNESPRSIAIPLSTNLHIAFDTQLLRMHTAWTGPSLNLFGPPYHGGKEPFICTHDGTTLWTLPQEYPWSAGADSEGNTRNLPNGARFVAVSTSAGGTSLLYDIAAGAGRSARVTETARQVPVGNRNAIVRRFELSPCDRDLRFLAHADLGRPRLTETPKPVPRLVMTRSNDFLLVNLHGPENVSLETEEREADYWREVITERGTEAGWERAHVQGQETRVYVRIPAHQNVLTFQTASLVCQDESELPNLSGQLSTSLQRATKDWESNRRTGERPKAKVLAGESGGKAPDAGDEHYRIEHFPLPKEANVMITGLDFFSNGDLAVCTWPGEVWIVEHATGPLDSARYRRFARGLNEPLGLKVINGKIHLVQKCELTRLDDTDGNGEADLHENISDGWDYTGNYHAFAFGPVTDALGNFYVALCGQRGRWDVPYLGWAIKISRDGRHLDGFCSGLRAPNGFGTFGPDRDLFVTDNEGNWIGACKLNHLKAGEYYGFPSATPAPKNDWGKKKEFTPPAVWFPKRLAPSASGLTEIVDDRFGPFKGQMLVGDFQNATVMRVMLERIGGEWQGAVWPFAKGFGSGVNRLAFGPDGNLYAGGLKNKAWPALGPREYSLDRVRFTGVPPFEIKEVHARPAGFELIFTAPADKASAGDTENYLVTQFAYKHHEPYGSPEFDHEGKPNRTTQIEVVQAAVSPDGLRVNLSLSGLKPGFVTQVRCGDLKSAESSPLRQSTFFYTLNRIPPP